MCYDLFWTLVLNEWRQPLHLDKITTAQSFKPPGVPEGGYGECKSPDFPLSQQNLLTRTDQVFSSLPEVRTEGVALMYKMPLYNRRKLHLAFLIAWETQKTRCRCVCQSQNIFPPVQLWLQSFTKFTQSSNLNFWLPWLFNSSKYCISKLYVVEKLLACSQIFSKSIFWI